VLCNVTQFFFYPTPSPSFLYTDHPNLKTTIYAERSPYKPSATRNVKKAPSSNGLNAIYNFRPELIGVETVVKNSVKITRRKRFETFVCIDRKREIELLNQNCKRIYAGDLLGALS
jgi:hypothetical protein